MSRPKKSVIPLESNPDVFNNLLRNIGAPSSLVFKDVPSLDLDLPRPALALILVSPSTGVYQAHRAAEDVMLNDSSRTGKGLDFDKDGMVWFRQTIGGACGFYALLHALANGPARERLDNSSFIGRLISECSSLSQEERCRYLDTSEELQKAYDAVARQGVSAPPDDLNDLAGYHYAAIVKAPSGRLYELDGSRCVGPIDCGVVLGPDEDVLCDMGVRLIKEYIEKDADSLGFNLMALV